MEIVIKIPDFIYTEIRNITNTGIIEHNAKTLYNAIYHGTPLPKHHKRIIDESKIKTIYYHIETSENERFRLEHIVIDGTDAPTIIEGGDNK
jgi:hypothetical protein